MILVRHLVIGNTVKNLILSYMFQNYAVDPRVAKYVKNTNKYGF